MRLVVWINSFIPGTVAGVYPSMIPKEVIAQLPPKFYTQVIPKGPYAGKTAVPLPGIARLNPLNTFKNWDSGFLTDQRDFSKDPDASCRIQSYAEISVPPHVSIIRQGHRTSGTMEVDMATGKQINWAESDLSDSTWSKLIQQVPRAPRSNFKTLPHVKPPNLNSPDPTYHLKVDASGSDPLVSAAAYIEFEGTFSIQFYGQKGHAHIEFSGLIDDFPAYECYAQLNGRTKTLWKAPPPKGNTVVSLLGGANRKVEGRVDFP